MFSVYQKIRLWPPKRPRRRPQKGWYDWLIVTLQVVPEGGSWHGLGHHGRMLTIVPLPSKPKQHLHLISPHLPKGSVKEGHLLLLLLPFGHGSEVHKTLQLVKKGKKGSKAVFLHNYGIVGIRRKEETKKERRTRRRRRRRVRRKFPILYIQTPKRPPCGCYWYIW